MRADKGLIKNLMYQDTEDIPDIIHDAIKTLHCVAHIDTAQNVVGIKGDTQNAPVLIAHTDTVLREPPSHIVSLNEWILAIDETGKQDACGADDRAGCAAILQLIPRLKNVVAVFCSYEESGAIGASMLNLESLQSACIVLELDRRIPAIDKRDAIWISNSATLASAACKQDLKTIFTEHGYHYNEGTFTDIGELKRRGLKPSAFNLSIGYMREHTCNEVLYIPAYETALDCVLAIVAACKDTYYPHDAVIQTHYEPLPGYEYNKTATPYKMSRRERRRMRRVKTYYDDKMYDEHYDTAACSYCGAHARLYDDNEHINVCEECLRLLNPYSWRNVIDR